MQPTTQKAPAFYLYGRPADPLSGLLKAGSFEIERWAECVQPPPLLTDPVSVCRSWRNLSNFHFEPDGSFVWTGEAAKSSGNNGLRWELCGTFFERDERHLYAEIQGLCDPCSWQTFLDVLSSTLVVRAGFAALLLGSPQALIPAEALTNIWQASGDLRYA